jgi:hypothetical protein
LQIHHLYTDEQGMSQVEQVKLRLQPSPQREGMLVSGTAPATTVMFSAATSGLRYPVHAASARALLIVLGGVWEFESGDGTVARLEAGDVMFADDVHSTGHHTRELTGNGNMIMVPFADGLDPEQLFDAISPSAGPSA